MSPKKHWQYLESYLVITAREMLPLASSGYKPGMLLNILQIIGPAPQQSYLAPDVNSVKVGLVSSLASGIGLAD